MRFIRKGGRVIPISDGDGKRKANLKVAKHNIAAGAVATAAGALYRPAYERLGEKAKGIESQFAAHAGKYAKAARAAKGTTDFMPLKAAAHDAMKTAVKMHRVAKAAKIGATFSSAMKFAGVGLMTGGAISAFRNRKRKE